MIMRRHSCRSARLLLLVAALVASSFVYLLVNAFPRELAYGQDAPVAEESHEPIWFRIVREQDVPVGLDTSIVRYTGDYVGRDGQTRAVSVSLVGAIHMAEKEYYETLNEKFTQFDTVVFELVTEGDANLKEQLKYDPDAEVKAPSPINIVGFMQFYMGRALGFSYQINGINYSAPNLRRGDCDASEFLIELILNGDVVRFFYDAFLDNFLTESMEDDVSLTAPIAILMAKNRRLVARRFFALELASDSLDQANEESREFDELQRAQEEGDAGRYNALNSKLREKERENVIIHFRNKKALEVARDELERGHDNIAIFYGAAHLADLGRRLETEFRLKRDEQVEWLRAWNMPRE